MDIPALLQEVFEIEADDIITTSNDKGLTFTVRPVNIGFVQVFLPKQKRTFSGALWSEAEQEVLTEVSVNDGGHETCHGQDELVAWLSMLLMEEEQATAQLQQIATTASKTFNWYEAVGGHFQCVPHPKVLMRVMRLRRYNRATGRAMWGFAVCIGDKVIGHEEAGRACADQNEAVLMCERVFQSALKKGKIPNSQPPAQSVVDIIDELLI